jgi:hypothetical protein
MLEWLFKADPKKTIAKKAVRRAKKLLRSRRAPSLNVKVDYVFWYGAVEIDPKHCVVWIIVAGPDSEQIPARLNPVRAEKSLRRAREHLKAEDSKWLEELAADVEEEFRVCGWEWQTPMVGIESAERVKRGGGFDYFR